MQYKLITNSTSIEVTKDGIISVIPNDSANRDWAEYRAWLDADPENQPLPSDD